MTDQTFSGGASTSTETWTTLTPPDPLSWPAHGTRGPSLPPDDPRGPHTQERQVVRIRALLSERLQTLPEARRAGRGPARRVQLSRSLQEHPGHVGRPPVGCVVDCEGRRASIRG